MRRTFTVQWVAQQFSDLTVTNTLGDGGQKEVFTAKHPIDGDVALKLFRLTVEEERALREVRAVQRVASPRVPAIYEVGAIDTHAGEVIWVREQFIPGRDLRKVLNQSQTLQPQDILRLALHMLEALASAEDVMIVHRDVKPENIRVGDDRTFWLIDFGIARHLDMKTLTPNGPFGHGTPGYAPPEQFRNIKPDIDARADLFALGVTLYECVEGVNPFWLRARDGLEAIRRVEQIPLPPISKQIDTSGEFKDFILALTRRQIDHRPSTAAEALSWIQEICNAEGIS